VCVCCVYVCVSSVLVVVGELFVNVIV